MIKIAILIPVFNKLEFTKTCLQSLHNLYVHQKGKPVYEIIVTDDGSADGTSEWISQNFPNTHLVHGDGNLWWSGGINEGAKYAINTCKSDFLLLWNNDITPASDYFDQLSKIVNIIDFNTIIGSKILFLDQPDTIMAHGCFFNPINGYKYLYGYGKKDSKAFNKQVKCDWLFGMGTLVPSGIAVKLNYWNAKHFPQYHGDSDFTYRAKKEGCKILSEPSLRIWNNTENTGNNFPKTLKEAYHALTSIRSDYNLKVEYRFHKFHSTGVFWIIGFLEKYFFFVYGFFKRKLFSSKIS